MGNARDHFAKVRRTGDHHGLDWEFEALDELEYNGYEVILSHVWQDQQENPEEGWRWTYIATCVEERGFLAFEQFISNWSSSSWYNSHTHELTEKALGKLRHKIKVRSEWWRLPNDLAA
jgi:calcineurin-like phosphoesterase family protein